MAIYFIRDWHLIMHERMRAHFHTECWFSYLFWKRSTNIIEMKISKKRVCYFCVFLVFFFFGFLHRTSFWYWFRKNRNNFSEMRCVSTNIYYTILPCRLAIALKKKKRSETRRENQEATVAAYERKKSMINICCVPQQNAWHPWLHHILIILCFLFHFSWTGGCIASKNDIRLCHYQDEFH